MQLMDELNGCSFLKGLVLFNVPAHLTNCVSVAKKNRRIPLKRYDYKGKYMNEQAKCVQENLDETFLS